MYFFFSFFHKKYVDGFSDRKKVAKAINAEIWSPGNVFRLAFNEGIKISKLNKFYDGNKHLKDVDFLNAILDDLQV
jgi:hypothetical protein